VRDEVGPPSCFDTRPEGVVAHAAASDSTCLPKADSGRPVHRRLPGAIRIVTLRLRQGLLLAH